MIEERLVDNDRGGISSWRWIIALIFTALLSTLSILRYHLYLAQGWDLGFYEQGLWALYHEGFHAWSSWGQYPVLSRSMAWVLWPLSVPYHFFGLGFLLVLQALAYGFGYVFLYDWMLLHRVPLAGIRIVGWLYLLNPLAWGVVLFDFHPAVLAIPAILASLTAADRGNTRAALLWLIPALLCQDLVILVVGLMGLAWFTQSKFDLAVGALVLASMATMLAIAGAQHLGYGFAIQKALYLQTAQSFRLHKLDNLRSVEYLVWVLAPSLLFGISLSAAIWLIPVIAIAGLNLSAANPLTTSPFSEFSLLTIPFSLFILTKVIASSSNTGKKLSTGLYILLFLAFLWHEAGLRHLAPSVKQGTALSAAVALVPSNAPVVTQNQLAPHVANRVNVLPIATTTRFSAGTYVIIDANHSVTISPSQLQHMLSLARDNGKTLYDNQGIYVIRVIHSVTRGA